MFKFSVRTILATILAILVMPVAFVNSTYAYSGHFHGSNYVLDLFNTLKIRPDSEAYWYVLNWGDNQIIDNTNCGDASCVSVLSEGYNSFVRLGLTPDATPGYYTNAEIAERYTGFAAGTPGKYAAPDYAHPVVLSTRVRWTGGYNTTGTGSAVGSSGMWLWNSPVDAVNGAYGYTESFGFNWAEADDVFTQGLHFNAYNFDPANYDIPFPVVSVPININMGNWNNISIIWSKESATQQRLTFFVNGQYTGSELIPSFGSLDLEVWNDNQVPTFEGVLYENPTQAQNFDIDYVSVTRL